VCACAWVGVSDGSVLGDDTQVTNWRVGDGEGVSELGVRWVDSLEPRCLFASPALLV